MKKVQTAVLTLFSLYAVTAAYAQNTIQLPIAAQAVADIGNGPVKARIVQGNASIFTSQGSGVGSTSGVSTALTLTATPITPPIIGGLISGAGITSGTTVSAYNGTTGVTLSAAMNVPTSTAVAWGAACPSSAAGIPAQFIQAGVSAEFYMLYTQARVCAISPGGPSNALLVLPVFYDQTTPGGGPSVVILQPGQILGNSTTSPAPAQGAPITAFGIDPYPIGTVSIVPVSADGASFNVYNQDGTLRVNSTAVVLTTNAITAIANSTLHFASVPATIVAGMGVFDFTNPYAITSGTTVISKTSTTVVLSNPIVNLRITSADQFYFMTNPTWFTDAVTYAGQHGYPLVCKGQGASSITNTVGTANVLVSNGPVTFPANLFWNVDLSACQIYVDGVGNATSSGFIMDSMELPGKFIGPSILATHGDADSLLYTYISGTPVDGQLNTGAANMHWPAVVRQGGSPTGGCVVKYDVSQVNAPILAATITYGEIFGGLRSQEIISGNAYVRDAVCVNDPGSGSGFIGVTSIVDLLHGFTRYGWTNGNAAACNNSAANKGNTFRIGRLAPDTSADGSANATGFAECGQQNSWEAYITSDGIGAGTFSAPFNLLNPSNGIVVTAFGTGPFTSANPVNTGTANSYRWDGLWNNLLVFGSASGSVQIQTNSVAGTPTLTLPNTSGTFMASTGTNDTNVTLSLNSTTGVLTPGWTGTLANARITNPQTTVNGQTCTLGSTCTVTIAASSLVLPITVSGTVTSGGIPYFSSTTNMASSTLLAANALVIGGGAGAAPATTTTGTGVVTALGVNTGTAGSFVVNGGALGSPLSAGTIPAYTLGGTISGGGNQVNNVIIGASTPLAGSFTTVTAPTIIGGAGTTGVQMTFKTTTGIGTTDAYSFTGGSNGGTIFGRWSASCLSVLATGCANGFFTVVGKDGNNYNAYFADASGGSANGIAVGFFDGGASPTLQGINSGTAGTLILNRIGGGVAVGNAASQGNGTFNVQTGYYINGTTGVSCGAGFSSVTGRSVGGIVTAC